MENVKNGSKVRLLIVDDSDFLRDFLKKGFCLDDEIVVVGECEDGDLVLDFLQKNSVNVILMDFSMKRMNGDVATKQVREFFPQVKIVGYSSHHEEVYRQRMIDSGAMGYVYKSTKIGQVANILKSVVFPNRLLVVK